MSTIFGTVKSIKEQDGGSHSIQIETDNGKFSCLAFKELNVSPLKAGSKATFVLDEKVSAKGNKWSQLKSFSFEGGAPQGAVNTPIDKNGISEPYLRFISNCVGNAITAQFIQQPSDIAAWAKHALIALKTINEPIKAAGFSRANDLNDDISDVG